MKNNIVHNIKNLMVWGKMYKIFIQYLYDDDELKYKTTLL